MCRICPVYYYRSEEFNSADYPTYVPIDKQVEVISRNEKVQFQHD